MYIIFLGESILVLFIFFSFHLFVSLRWRRIFRYGQNIRFLLCFHFHEEYVQLLLLYFIWLYLERKYIYNEMIFLKSLTKTILFRYASTSSTIFALATGQQLRSGVAIIRVSGANATQSLLTLTKETSLEKFQPTKLYLRNLYHHKSNDLIDQCMAVWFKGK